MAMDGKIIEPGERLVASTKRLVMDYERRFGKVPEWVADELPLHQQVALIAVAKRLQMKLAPEYLLLGEGV